MRPPCLVLTLLLGCTAPPGSAGPGAGPTGDTAGGGDGGDDNGGGDGGGDDDEVEQLPGVEEVGIFDPETVHVLELELDAHSYATLAATPDEYVGGTVTFEGRTWERVGIRVKGSASYQPLDEKPALKLKFHEYDKDQRFLGLERLTLNNEVWDPTMMAENLSYEAWRAAGSPAPRTGYATVSLNGRYLGLYAILETMDDDFVDHTWPGSEGGLWEMTRNCDFTGDCTCFELQETGSSYEPGAVAQGCEAAAEGTVEALQAAFDWEALVAFLAVELAVNHPDSYSFNLNNFFVYHDPIEDRLSLSPWGADSTFIYAYPPSTDNPDCRPLYRDVLTSSPKGWLMDFCLEDPTCSADLEAEVLEVAAWMEESQLVARMEETRDRLDPYAALEVYVNWTAADRERRVGCFLEFTEQRPEELRAWVAAR